MVVGERQEYRGPAGETISITRRRRRRLHRPVQLLPAPRVSGTLANHPSHSARLGPHPSDRHYRRCLSARHPTIHGHLPAGRIIPLPRQRNPAPCALLR
jgi:hypothetical protein